MLTVERSPRIFGEPPGEADVCQCSLRLRFHAEHLPLRWSDCSATANFLSAYCRPLLAGEYSARETADVTHSIAYLANELLENAVKFRAPGEIELEMGRCGGEFYLRIANRIASATSAAFQELLAELTAGDPGELLLQRIEANAAEETSGGSGLGILTLMSDYGVRFCWTFAPASSQDAPVHLETLARLPLPAKTA